MKTIMADPYPIRPITADEYGSFRRVHQHAFNGGPLPEARLARGIRQFEADRSLAAVDATLPAGEEMRRRCPCSSVWCSAPPR